MGQFITGVLFSYYLFYPPPAHRFGRYHSPLTIIVLRPLNYPNVAAGNLFTFTADSDFPEINGRMSTRGDGALSLDRVPVDAFRKFLLRKFVRFHQSDRNYIVQTALCGPCQYVLRI